MTQSRQKSCKGLTSTPEKEESVANYVAELRSLADYCNFGESLEAMLRDRLMCGINDAGIQTRLLAEAKLTYKRALEIAKGQETAI